MATFVLVGVVAIIAAGIITILFGLIAALFHALKMETIAEAIDGMPKLALTLAPIVFLSLAFILPPNTPLQDVITQFAIIETVATVVLSLIISAVMSNM